ncbi:MAG: methylmalonyl Co-A mutase-associated GTPase MeaB, partial [Myxococcales bacterium]
RSMSSRGQLGGLSAAAPQAVRVLEGAGCEVILVETVGVGQAEVEIASLADTTIVLLAPGMGDGIQAAKAGILEVADLFVVNKADREGADRTVRDLRSMLELSQAKAGNDDFDVQILKCVASRDEGVKEVWGAIETHHRHLQQGGGLLERETLRARTELLEILRERLLREAVARLAQQGARLDDLALRIARREVDPYTVAEEAVRT